VPLKGSGEDRAVNLSVMRRIDSYLGAPIGVVLLGILSLKKWFVAPAEAPESAKGRVR
jgi:hypothetical protein